MLARFAYSAWLFILAANALTVSTDKTSTRPINLSIGDIKIDSGAKWSILNNALSVFVGDLEVQKDAGFYISSTSSIIALTVTLFGVINSITNDGIISFNSQPSLSSSTYDLIGASFTNNGEMYLAASGILPNIMGITSISWHNNGLLVFSQNQRNEGFVELGSIFGEIHNDGQICFMNHVYRQKSKISGTGCITADSDSTIYIANAGLPVSSGQAFYLKDKDSSIIVEALSTPQTFNVYGFGDGNKVGLTVPLVSLLSNSWSYDDSTGILQLKGLGSLKQNFKIGTGYDKSKFKVVTDSGAGLPSTLFGSLQYNGPVPNPGQPSECQECKPVPSIPDEPSSSSALPSSSSASSSAPSSSAQSSSESSISPPSSSLTSSSTQQSSDSNSAAPSSSSATQPSSESSSSAQSSSVGEPSTTTTAVTSEFTSTWTTTNSDGSVETDPGIVSESGSYFTTLTTFPQSTNDLTTEFTSTWTTTNSDEFTSSWTTTNSDGSVATESGIVSESGSYFTTLTTFPQSTNDSTTESTSTWTTTNSDGSVKTGSGIVSESGPYLTTLTTFPHSKSSGIWSNATTPGPINTVTEDQTTIITITSCEENKCHETTVPGTLSHVTTTVNSVETVYTTYCPISSEETGKTNDNTVTKPAKPTGSKPTAAKPTGAKPTESNTNAGSIPQSTTPATTAEESKAPGQSTVSPKPTGSNNASGSPPASSGAVTQESGSTNPTKGTQHQKFHKLLQR
ncbi:unnamed protein product [Candida verbasci]|uniref:Hyphally-regulated cell wall protein N-terminal domain-containing protein n=1 Tax=Candida verbasci TaxID=1227364 RepID=A0A9W4TWF9_9ASCO|nr:unnamed protein product [Candida verbasci]